MRFKHGDGIDMQKGIVDGIEDKVTQDVGKWTSYSLMLMVLVG